MPRKQWSGQPDRSRPLSEEGWRQAKALAEVLAGDARLDAIFASPFTRCRQTVETLADQAGLEVVTDERIAESAGVPVTDGGDAWVSAAWLAGRALSLIDEVLARHPGGRVVVCTHGDVVPALLALLDGRDGLGLQDVRVRKAARVALDFAQGRCVRARQVPAVDQE